MTEKEIRQKMVGVLLKDYTVIYGLLEEKDINETITLVYTATVVEDKEDTYVFLKEWLDSDGIKPQTPIRLAKNDYIQLIDIEFVSESVIERFIEFVLEESV